MTIAAAFLVELTKDSPAIDLWLEVEGLPYAFGLTSRAASWFAARYVEHQRDGILDVMMGPPSGVEQEVRPFDADSSIGQLTASLLEDSGGYVHAMYANSCRRDNWGRLTADLGVPAAASGAPAAVNVAMTPPAGTIVGSYLYVGRETMKVTALPGGGVVSVYRGMFRPLAATEARAYVHTAGDVVTLYPRFLRTRRAYFYSAPFGGTDADKVARWGGTIDATEMRAGLAGVDLTIQSIEAELRVKCFTGQIRGKLLVGLTAPDGSYDLDEGEPAPLTTSVRLEPTSISGRAWIDNDRIVFRLGDEIVSGRLVAATQSIVFDTPPDDGRGLFATPAEEHRPGDELVEVIPIIGYNANGSREERVSRFTKGDNPLDVVLQVLLSYTGDASNGAYDVLPAGWGRGLDQVRLDVARIVALRDRWLPAAREIRIIEEPFEAKEFVASVLRTHLCYPVALLDDVLTFRFLAPPMPDVAPRAVTGTHVTGMPRWASGEDSVVGRMTLKCDYDPIEDEYRQTFQGEFQGPGTEAQEFYAGRFETTEIECPGQWSGNDPGAAKWGALLSTDAETIALRHFDLMKDRRARPFPTIQLECQYDQLVVEVGDLLAVTVDGVPDVSTGAAGLVGAICEARRKTPDDRAGKVTLAVVQTAYGQQYRVIAPSGIVDHVSGAQLWLTWHEFTDPSGTSVDIDLFPAPEPSSYKVAVWSPDLTTKRGSYTVTLRGAYLTITESLSAVVAGDVVVLDDAAVQPAYVKARHAFLADNSNPPLIGADAAHEFTP